MVAPNPNPVDHYTNCIDAAYKALPAEWRAEQQTALVLLVAKDNILAVRCSIPTAMVPAEYGDTLQDKVEACETMTGHLLLSAAIRHLGIQGVEAGVRAAKEAQS